MKRLAFLLHNFDSVRLCMYAYNKKSVDNYKL